jgi:hypothetical protein
MNKIVVTVLFSFLLHPLIAQNVTKGQKSSGMQMVADSAKRARAMRSTAPLERLAQSGVLRNCEEVSYLYYATARQLYKMDKKRLRNLKENPDMMMQDPTVKRILQYYQQGIDTCQTCTLLTKRDRYEFLKNIKSPEEVRNTDLPELKMAGYKPSREGPGVGVFYMRGGGSNWLGAEVAAFSSLQPFWKMRDRKGSNEGGGKLLDKNMPSAFAAFSFSYARELGSKTNEFTFSVLHTSSPLSIYPARFGFYRSSDNPALNNKWFYRPGIGFGFGRFSVSYAYNVVPPSARDAAPQ